MFLTDVDISSQNTQLVRPYDEQRTTNIGYDLTTDSFCVGVGDERKQIELAPGESVFVKSVEAVYLNSKTMAQVTLRNSRIRQGLELTAPVYQPGHATKVFYRITNVSKQVIELSSTDDLAMIMFYQFDHPVAHPYEGAFQSEFNYSGMSSYSSTLSDQLTDIEKKVESVKEIERTLYGNVLALMAIFVGIFSLVNVNVSLVSQNVDIWSVLTLNFATVGSVGFLVAIINTVLPTGKHRTALWVVCAVAFAMAILVQLIK